MRSTGTLYGPRGQIPSGNWRDLFSGNPSILDEQTNPPYGERGYFQHFGGGTMNTPWVNFETIKRTVSLEMVLNHYRVELRADGRGTLRGKCPLPTHGSGESNTSFSATLTKGRVDVWA